VASPSRTDIKPRKRVIDGEKRSQKLKTRRVLSPQGPNGGEQTPEGVEDALLQSVKSFKPFSLG